MAKPTPGVEQLMLPGLEFKECSLCSESLPLSCFYERSPGVLRHDCKTCHSRRGARYREQNKDQLRAAKRQYHLANRERDNKRTRRWREANPEAFAVGKRRSYEKNRDYYLIRMREYRQANPEQTQAIILAWRSANPELVRRYNRQYRARKKQVDPEAYLAAARQYAQERRRAAPEIYREYSRKYRAKKRQASIGEITPELLAAKFTYWGWRCWLCGTNPTEADHVKPLNKGGPHCLANLRPICKPCNSGKCDRWPFPVGGVPRWLLAS